jgi:hypothetical protein
MLSVLIYPTLGLLQLPAASPTGGEDQHEMNDDL